MGIPIYMVPTLASRPESSLDMPSDSPHVISLEDTLQENTERLAEEKEMKMLLDMVKFKGFSIEEIDTKIQGATRQIKSYEDRKSPKSSAKKNSMKNLSEMRLYIEDLEKDKETL